MLREHKPRISSDVRGFISCGKRDEKGNPQKLYYFDVTDFAELVAQLGAEPKEIVVYMPANETCACFDDEFNTWGLNKAKKRSCDGVDCMHRIPETVGGTQYAAGEISPCVCLTLADNDKQRCKYQSHLKAYIADAVTLKVISPVCYTFRNHSESSGGNVFSELERVRALTLSELGEARLMGIPFLLSVAKGSQAKNANATFPVWRLQVLAFDRAGAMKLQAVTNAPQLTNGNAEIQNLRTEIKEIIEQQNAAGFIFSDKKRATVQEWLDKKPTADELAQGRAALISQIP